MRPFDSTSEALRIWNHLRELCAHEKSPLMLTNPNTLGCFEKNIQQICQIVHDAGASFTYGAT